MAAQLIIIECRHVCRQGKKRVADIFRRVIFCSLLLSALGEKKDADRSLLNTVKPVVKVSVPAADGTSHLQRKDATFFAAM